jgi:CheY-like chemotaxis protein
MNVTPKMVLLVGESTKATLPLERWLSERGCQCRFAGSFREACRLLSEMEFEVVLSQYQLPDRTAFPLLDWLDGSSTTLFLSATVENGTLWLPMIEHGKRCVGAPLLRPGEFKNALAKVLNSEIPTNELELVAADAGGERAPAHR